MRKNIYIPIDTMIIHDLHINKLVKRGDALTLKIRIFENGVAKELGGQAVDVILKKVDGTNLEKSLDSVTGSDLNIDFSNQATNVSGELKGEIQIYDSTGQSSTNTFMLVVQDSLADDVLDKSVDDIQVLTDLKNLINENKKILEEYKEELLQIAGTTEAVNALIQIQALIDDTLPQLIEQNQLALANINSLDNKNTLAATNISTLEDLNTQAQLLIDQLKSLIEANSVAEKNLTDLTALNQISAGLKNNLTSLNNTATTLKEDLTNLISQGDTVYNTLHDEVVLADEKIKTMQSFDPESVLPDVTELKQEVHDARGTYPSLNDRITNIIGGEDATKVYIGDTEPEYDGVWFDTSADGTEDPTPENPIVTAFKKYVEDEVLTQLPNPNLLINGDFQVWQRGESFKVTDGVGSIADGWIIRGDSNVLVTKGDSINISNPNQVQVILEQFIVDGLNYLGKTLTLSIKIKDKEVLSCSGILSTEYIQTGNNDTPNLFFNYSSDTGNIRVGYAFDDITIDIEWLKLELGDTATNFLPKTYIQELQDSLIHMGTIPYSNPNLLINGDFQVWQRGTSFSCTAGVQYTADRWAMWTGGTPTISQATGGYSLQWVGYGNDNLLQMIELPKSNTGRNMTLSFLVNAPVGVEVVVIVNNATTITGSQTKQVGKTFNGTGAWQYCVLNVPASVTNSDIIRVQFAIGKSGKDKTISITKVKLEIGDIATPFISRPYGLELALCQRYYQTMDFHASYFSSKNLLIFQAYPVPMRVAPTILIQSDANTELGKIDKYGYGRIDIGNYSTGKSGKTLLTLNSDLDVFTDGSYYRGMAIMDSEIY